MQCADTATTRVMASWPRILGNETFSRLLDVDIKCPQDPQYKAYLRDYAGNIPTANTFINNTLGLPHYAAMTIASGLEHYRQHLRDHKNLDPGPCRTHKLQNTRER